MEQNTTFPTYQELINLNPFLQKKSEEEVSELVMKMKEIGYIWDDRSKRFYHPDTGKYIRTQGLDLFTPKSIRELFEEEKNEIQSMPNIVRLAGTAQQIWTTLTKAFLIAAFLLLTSGWFFISPIEIFSWLISMLIIWVIVAVVTNLLHKPLRDFRDSEMRKKFGKSR